MKKIMTLFSLMTLFLFTSCAINFGSSNSEKPEPIAQSKNENVAMNYRPSNEKLKMLEDFPAAKENQDRYVIWSPELSESAENNRIVELVPFMMKEVDCNLHHLMGTFEEETVEGFGYNYYVFETDGEVSSTLMACPDDEKVNKKVYGESKLLRYNSNMPIVIYVPKGVEIESNLFIKQ